MTSGLGVDKDAIENTVYELLLGESSVEDLSAERSNRKFVCDRI